MKTYLGLASVLLAGTLCVNTAARSAQPAETNLTELFDSISITIDGRQTPHLVPLNVTMMHFFLRFDLDPDSLRLKLQLTAKDMDVLRTSRRNRDIWMNAHEDWVTDRFVAIHNEFAPRGPLTLAAKLDELEQDNISRMDKYYEGMLKKLSRRGEDSVRKFVRTNIHPVFTTVTNTAVANAAPAFFMQDISSRSELLQVGPLNIPGLSPAPGTTNTNTTTTTSTEDGEIVTITPPVEGAAP